MENTAQSVRIKVKTITIPVYQDNPEVKSTNEDPRVQSEAYPSKQRDTRTACLAVNDVEISPN